MSKTLNILNCQGENVGEYVVPDTAIELEKGAAAVHEAVVAILAGQRAGTACTKTRGLVRGGGAKPFRQKGRGGARAGSNRSPVWVGGGTIFGPQPRSYAKKLEKPYLPAQKPENFTTAYPGFYDRVWSEGKPDVEEEDD